MHVCVCMCACGEGKAGYLCLHLWQCHIRVKECQCGCREVDLLSVCVTYVRYAS